MLFDDEGLIEASARRRWAQAQSTRSEPARAADASKRADDGLPMHRSGALLRNPVILAYKVIPTALKSAAKIALTTRPTAAPVPRPYRATLPAGRSARGSCG
jgi:hypothetical protein